MNKINAVRVSDIFLEALDTPSSAFHGSWFLLLVPRIQRRLGDGGFLFLLLMAASGERSSEALQGKKIMAVSRRAVKKCEGLEQRHDAWHS